ncbi:MAG: tryptophan 7-halogenase, partial [Bdellovibrionales bacterium]|nr:tryptophan 7-halogenase [Bdellovibrionales bacterium]
HILKVPMVEFYKEVRPLWKLGIQFQWAEKQKKDFFYPFGKHLARSISEVRLPLGAYATQDLRSLNVHSCLMELNRAPFFQEPGGTVKMGSSTGLHIENSKFVGYLLKLCQRRGIEAVDTDVVHFQKKSNGEMAWVQDSEKRRYSADFFIDASGFASQISQKTLNIPFKSFSDRLLTDRAIVGGYVRDEPIRNYTGAHIMPSGWCFRIDHDDRVNLGYVHSSGFVDEDEAVRQFQKKTAGKITDPHVVRFRTGRLRSFWNGNTLAVGNASGFVEPLEATALHVLLTQIWEFCLIYKGRSATGSYCPELARSTYNDFIADLWDDTADFLTLHYKFGGPYPSAFWRWCRRELPLKTAEKFVKLYEAFGPNLILKDTLRGPSIFGIEGYLSLAVGLKIPCPYSTLSPSEEKKLGHFRWRNRQVAKTALQAEMALDLLKREPEILLSESRQI